jgi:hypothetical protein
MSVSAALADPPLRYLLLVVREARSEGWNECVCVVACEIRDTLHEERILGRFRGKPSCIMRVNELSAEDPEKMGEQESQPETVGMEGCVAEGEGRGSSTGFAAAAP